MSNPSKTQRDKPRFWTKGTILFFVALGTILLLFAFWRILNWSARAAVQREIARMRTRGEATTLAEMAPPLVNEEDNAAVVLQQAFIELNSATAVVDADKSLLGWGGEPDGDWTCAQYADVAAQPTKMRRVLDPHARALELLREALARPVCRFDLKYERGFEMELNHLAQLRAFARLLRAEALWRARARGGNEAVRSVIDALRLARCNDDEPLLISHLVRMAMVQIALGAFYDVRNTAEFSDDALAALGSELAQADLYPQLPRVLIAERAGGTEMVARVMAGDIELDKLFGHAPPALETLIAGVPFLAYRDELRRLRVMGEFVDAARRPMHEALPDVATTSAEIEALPHWRAPFTRLLAVGLGSAFEKYARVRAQIDTARVGIAVLRYRLARGTYPPTLDRLVPKLLTELPADPHTGKGIRYRLTPEGFVVYTLGPNRTDEGGNFFATGWDEWDLVFEHPRPTDDELNDREEEARRKYKSGKTP